MDGSSMWENSPYFLSKCLLLISLLICTTLADSSRFDKQVTRSKREVVDAKTVGNALYNTPENVIEKREEIPIPSSTIKAENDGVIRTNKAEDATAKKLPETGDARSAINVKDRKLKDGGLLARIKTNGDKKAENTKKRSKGEVKIQSNVDVDSKAEEEDESLIKGMDSNVDHPLVDSDLTKQYRESTDIDHGEMMGIETERDVTIGEPINSDNSLLKHTITNDNIENVSEQILTEQKRDSVTLTVDKRHHISSSEPNFAVVKRSANLDNDLLPLSKLNTRYALTEGELNDGGPPSHFQVDDKSADLEINANSAGVKVKAKPASLQVVSRPGSPHSHPYIPDHHSEDLGYLGFHHPHHHHHHHSCCHHEGYRRRRCCVDHPHRKCCHHRRHHHHHRRHHIYHHSQSRHVNFLPEPINEELGTYRHHIAHPPNRWGGDPLSQIITTFAQRYIRDQRNNAPGERNNAPASEVGNIEPEQTNGFSVPENSNNNMQMEQRGSRRSFGRYGVPGYYGNYGGGYTPARYHDVHGSSRSDVETAIDPRLGSSSFANGFNSGIALPDEDSMYLNHFRPETLDDRERIHQNHLRQLQDSTYKQFADELAFKEQNVQLDQHRFANPDQHSFPNYHQTFHHQPAAMHQHQMHALGDNIPDQMAMARGQASQRPFRRKARQYHGNKLGGYHGNLGGYHAYRHHVNDARHIRHRFNPYPKYTKYQERMRYFDAPDSGDDTFPSDEETIDKSGFTRHSPGIEKSEVEANSVSDGMGVDDEYRKRSFKHMRRTR